MPRITGRYERTRVGGEEVAAFIPEPLPPLITFGYAAYLDRLRAGTEI